MKLINVLDQKIKIDESYAIPAFLFGTYKKIDPESIKIALEHGFFAFDMAAVYNTEDLLLNEIGKYIQQHKLLNCRSKFYFLYKLDATKLTPEQVEQQTNVLLSKIAKVFPETNPYIDLLAIHAPNHRVPIEQTWAKMQELGNQGKTLAIGVSNFNVHHLQCMQSLQLGLPLINQIELNPFFAQKELAEYCHNHGIIISAYRSANNKATAIDLEILSNIATELNLSPMQIINSWKFTKGMQIVSISKNPSHIEELTKVVQLETKYMQLLDNLDKGDLGRTCSGSWSSFDFNGTRW